MEFWLIIFTDPVSFALLASLIAVVLLMVLAMVKASHIGITKQVLKKKTGRL